MLCRADLFSLKTHQMYLWNLTQMASFKFTASLGLFGKHRQKLIRFFGASTTLMSDGICTWERSLISTTDSYSKGFSRAI